MELGDADIRPERPEAVNVCLALAAPVDELDAELERGIGLAHEFVFIDLERGVVDIDQWDGGFTDADDADFL